MAQPNEKFCAYKVVPTGTGLMFLFDNVDRDGFSVGPQMNFFEGNLYLEFGQNVLLITPDILNELITAPMVIIAHAPFDQYQISDLVYSFAMNQIYLARLQGAMEVMATGAQG